MADEKKTKTEKAPDPTVDQYVEALRTQLDQYVEVHAAYQAANGKLTTLQEGFRASLRGVPDSLPVLKAALEAQANQLDRQGGGINYDAAIRGALRAAVHIREGV